MAVYVLQCKFLNSQVLDCFVEFHLFFVEQVEKVKLDQSILVEVHLFF